MVSSGYERGLLVETAGITVRTSEGKTGGDLSGIVVPMVSMLFDVIQQILFDPSCTYRTMTQLRGLDPDPTF